MPSQGRTITHIFGSCGMPETRLFKDAWNDHIREEARISLKEIRQMQSYAKNHRAEFAPTERKAEIMRCQYAIDGVDNVDVYVIKEG